MASKVETLKRLTGYKRAVAFVAHTPGTQRGTSTQSVILKDATVRQTGDGNYVITGRDIQLEADRGRIDHENPVIRSFRIDRIVNGTIMSKFSGR